MSNNGATRTACERCGHDRVEVCRSDRHGQWLCLNCYCRLNEADSARDDDWWLDGSEASSSTVVDESPNGKTAGIEEKAIPAAPQIQAPPVEQPNPTSPSFKAAVKPKPKPQPTNSLRENPPTNSLGEKACSDGPEVEFLLAEYKNGRATPVEVALPTVPNTRSEAVSAVAELFRLVYGLRLSVDEDRPVPFGSAWVAGKLGGRFHEQTIWRARRVLVDAGVLIAAGKLPGRGARGTELYLPGDVTQR